MNTKTPVTLDGSEKEYHSKIYTAPRDNAGGYGKPIALDESINRENYFNGGESFSKMENHVFHPSNANRKWSRNFSIIHIKNNAGQWSPQLLHPSTETLRLDIRMEGELFGQKVLYFSWICWVVMEDMICIILQSPVEISGTPVNLGNVINTPKNEETPFYSDGVFILQF